MLHLVVFEGLQNVNCGRFAEEEEHVLMLWGHAHTLIHHHSFIHWDSWYAHSLSSTVVSVFMWMMVGNKEHVVMPESGPETFLSFITILQPENYIWHTIGVWPNFLIIIVLHKQLSCLFSSQTVIQRWMRPDLSQTCWERQPVSIVFVLSSSASGLWFCSAPLVPLGSESCHCSRKHTLFVNWKCWNCFEI